MKVRRATGFTLIEMMIVVVIIAVLAGVAIVAYTRHLKSGRIVDAKAFLATIQSRQEMYFQQHGYYCNASNGNNWHPSTNEPVSKAWDPPPAGQRWQDLGARPESGSSYFQFQVVASVPAVVTGPPRRVTHTPDATAGSLGIVQPGGTLDDYPWYYVLARCDLDGSSSCTATPLSDSSCTLLWSTNRRSDVVILNEGK